MIRAGKLDRTIALQREAETVSPAGSVTRAWSTFATVRAQLVERKTQERLEAHGEADTARVAFRIRYLPDLSTNDRVSFEGRAYSVESVVEIGRRRGLDLVCEAVR